MRAKYYERLLIWITILVSFISLAVFYGCHPLYGLIESEFELSSESRLPKWFSIPPQYTRKDVSLTLTYYTHPISSKVKMVLRGPLPEHKVLSTKVGSDRWHPQTERQYQIEGRGNIYPKYSIITVDNVEEVIEQRKPEPFLYVSDDPKLTAVIKKE